MRGLEDLIAEHPFFAGMVPEYQALVAGCGENAAYQAGEYLVRSGTPAEHFFMVRKGRVSLEITIPGKDPFVFETVSEGEVIGWSWLFEPYRAQFDARAVEATRVVRFDGTCLRGKCEANAKLGYDLMKRFARMMTRRFADTRLQLIDVYGQQSQ